MTDTQAPSTALELFATCPQGFEQLLAGELASLGAEGVRALHGQVAFSGNLETAYRACLWSRIASRVVLVLSHATSADADELYEGLYELPWENHIALTSTFAVDAHGTNNELRNTQFIALRAKDAVCDRLQAKLGARPSVETRNPDVTIVVRVRNNRMTCGIDLSGDPLFRRGTSRRAADDGLGGMRPDYAAAMLAAGALGLRRARLRGRRHRARPRARAAAKPLGLHWLARPRREGLGRPARRGRRARRPRGREGRRAHARNRRPAPRGRLGRERGAARKRHRGQAHAPELGR